MATWMDNPHSYWIKGEFWDAWADANELHVTDGKPELVWVDLETTGLDTEEDVTIEVGLVLTDALGNICRDGAIDWRVWRFEEATRSGKSWQRAFDEMPDVVKDMHTKSGLIADLERAKTLPEVGQLGPKVVGLQASMWLEKMCDSDVPLELSGSSPHFDRGFLKADLKTLESWFNYRSGVDVSGIREVARRINKVVVASQPVPGKKHRPIPDLIDSIKLYRHFLSTGFLAMDADAKVKF